MKLDLINSRVDPPPSNRVFDSLEDSPVKPSRSDRSMVRMVPTQVEVRTGSNKRFGMFAKDRFDGSIVDNKGDKVFIKDRHAPALPRRKLPVINFASLSNPKNTSSDQSVASTFLEDAFNTQTFKVETSFHCEALDIIKDKVHDNFDHTISSRVAAGKIPGAWNKAERSLMAKDEPTGLGPGCYQITDANLRSILSPSISKLGRYDEAVPEDLLPLEKRLRLERMRANMSSPSRSRSRSPSATRTGRSLERSSSPLSRTSSLSPSKPFTTSEKSSPSKGTISMASRFSGPLYRVEGYIKTNGLLLGPDFDAHFDKRIPFDMSKSQLSTTRSRSPSPGVDVEVDVEKYFAMSKTVLSSPVRYAAAFQSKAEVGLKIPPPTTAPEIGPGSYPNAYHPSVEVKEPNKLSLSFLGGEKGLFIRKAAPDGYDDTRPFAERHRKGPKFTLAADPNRKNHLAQVAERKMSQIYPQFSRRQSFASSSAVSFKGSIIADDVSLGSSQSSPSLGRMGSLSSKLGSPSTGLISPPPILSPQPMSPKSLSPSRLGSPAAAPYSMAATDFRSMFN